MSFLGEARSYEALGSMEICRKESVSALSGHVPMEVLTPRTHVCMLRKTGSNGNREKGRGSTEQAETVSTESRQSSQRNREPIGFCVCVFFIDIVFSIYQEIDFKELAHVDVGAQKFEICRVG